MVKVLTGALLLTLLPNFSSTLIEDYILNVPNTDQHVNMIAVQGGSYKMGSPDTESNRDNDEGPQVEVNVNSFWMAATETTWDLYLIYTNKDLEIDENLTLDAISRPTPPYVEMSFGQGKKGGFPVCNVTQYAARSFCKWLYEKTGDFYRLPTEAEWEFAARAGSTTAYSFGNSDDELEDFAWFFDNSDGHYSKVGSKQANAWGFYDMYGNVAEWTSDQYFEDYHSKVESQNDNPYFEPRVLYPHTIKGGHWDSYPEECRSASREPSTAKLKRRDPQIPKSDWWLTNAPFLGFRIVKPVNQPSKEEIEAYYKAPPKDI